MKGKRAMVTMDTVNTVDLMELTFDPEKWDYAELTRVAKILGGPKELVKTIRDVAFRKGFEAGYEKGFQEGFNAGVEKGLRMGRSKAVLKCVIVGVAAAGGTALVCYVVSEVRLRARRKKEQALKEQAEQRRRRRMEEEKRRREDEIAKAAEELLIQGIREYDATHPDGDAGVEPGADADEENAVIPMTGEEGSDHDHDTEADRPGDLS